MKIDTLVQIISVITSPLTVLIAFYAMRGSNLLARETLEENRISKERDAFETRCSELIKIHNSMHDKVCDYIDGSPKLLVDNNEMGIFDVINRRDGLPHLFGFLTGHPILSPYMRVLYHLLKHINSSDYIKNKQDSDKRSYSSVIRSTIRNDVLFLVAVNSLNTQGIGGSESGYPEYQKILHRFNFFEHAIFSNPTKPNNPNSREYKIEFLSSSQGTSWSVVGKINMKEIKDYNEFEEYISDCFSDNEKHITPYFACVFLYENPERDIVLHQIDNHYNELVERARQVYSEKKEIHEQLAPFNGCVGGCILSISNCEVKYDINSVKELDNLLRKIFWNLELRDDAFFNTPNCTALNHKRLNDDYLYSELLDYCVHHDVKYALDDAVFFDRLQKYIDTKKGEVLSRIKSTWLHKFD